MTKDERLFKRALDVLDWAHDVFGLEEEGIATKTALRERVAQPDPVLTHIKRLEESVKAQREMLAGLEQEMRDVLRLAQDALQMASAPFPVDEVKTLRALQAVNRLLQEMEQP